METITTYVNNLFKNLPITDQVTNLKKEMLFDMEAKYHDLRQNGKTENEAIGIVISEFGNIEELMDELGITQTNVQSTNETTKFLSDDDVYNYLKTHKKFALLTGLGVSLILIGVSVMIGFNSIIDSIPFISSSFLPVILFIFLIPAVAIFIYSDSTIEPYKYIDKGNFNISVSTYEYLKDDFNQVKSNETTSTIIGVSLILFSVVVLLILSAINSSFATLGVSIMLFLISCAVFLFIFYGDQKDSYEKLFKSINRKKKEGNKIIGAIAALVWPLATCIFFIFGVIKGFHISWVVFPITAILFGAFSAFINTLTEK